MIKNGKYHVSLAAGTSELFLSQSDPPLILYKHPDDTLRNEKGDKCVAGGARFRIYLNGKLSICKTLFHDLVKVVIEWCNFFSVFGDNI